MTTNMWLWWLHIAVRNEVVAKQSRQEALELGPSADGFTSAMTSESYASLVGVAA